MTSDSKALANVTIGHATNHDAATGCSVIVFDRPVACVADVRGGAPGSRETDLLAPGRLVQRVDAIVLTGGSAFGLAVADGVMMCTGRAAPSKTGPMATLLPAAVLSRL